MNKHSKKHFVAKRTQNGTRFRSMSLLIILVVLLCTVIFFIYHRHESPVNSFAKSSQFSKYYSNITAWVAEHRKHLVKKVVNAKQTRSNQEDEPQIHFEFYTALPNMQLAGSNTTQKKAEKVSPAKMDVEVADAEELEHELSDAAKEAR